MHSGIRVLDPVITTAHITRNHAYMIYDTLLGIDETYKPKPQMADWKVSDGWPENLHLHAAQRAQMARWRNR